MTLDFRTGGQQTLERHHAGRVLETFEGELELAIRQQCGLNVDLSTHKQRAKGVGWCVVERNPDIVKCVSVDSVPELGGQLKQ
jgi:hypothetical protein